MFVFCLVASLFVCCEGRENGNVDGNDDDDLMMMMLLMLYNVCECPSTWCRLSQPWLWQCEISCVLIPIRNMEGCLSATINSRTKHKALHSKTNSTQQFGREKWAVRSQDRRVIHLTKKCYQRNECVVYKQQQEQQQQMRIKYIYNNRCVYVCVCLWQQQRCQLLI